MQKSLLKKSLFFLFLFTFYGTHVSFGQLELGFKGGVGFSNLSIVKGNSSSLKELSQHIVGYSFGISSHISAPSMIPIAMEVGLQFKDVGFPHLQYIQVPVMLKVYVPFKKAHVFVGAEGYASLELTSNQDCWSVRIENELVRLKSQYWDYGVGPVFGIRLGLLEFYAGYYFGLQNIINEQDNWGIEMRNQGFFLFTAIHF